MDPEPDLATLVVLAGSGTVRTLLDRIRAAGFEGVLPSHGYVLQVLLDTEPTIGELAGSLRITQQGASKQVGELERLGYVERIGVPGDQRVRRVRLTEAGLGVLEAGRAARAELEELVAERVGSEAVAAAKQALGALLAIEGLGPDAAAASDRSSLAMNPGQLRWASEQERSVGGPTGTPPRDD